MRFAVRLVSRRCLCPPRIPPAFRDAAPHLGAADINVGTATIGALIGAGGYGEPILTGLRLFDIPLILQGAVPAALLALLAQPAFEFLEPLVVPRGLRLAGAAK
jgi:osmoprotectant transport system permease protein